MPPYFETAAHILLFLTKSGLKICAGVHYRTVILRLAYLIELKNVRYPALTHAATAIWIMEDLVVQKYVELDAKQRSKLLAVLGTGIGNIPAQARYA